MEQNRLILRWVGAAVLSALFVTILGASLRPTSLAKVDKAPEVDWNHVNYFWIRLDDLYRMNSASPAPAPGTEVRLIEESLKAAEE